MYRTKFTERFELAIDKAIHTAQHYVKEKLSKDSAIDLYEVDSKNSHSSKKLGRYNILDQVIDKL